MSEDVRCRVMPTKLRARRSLAPASPSFASLGALLAAAAVIGMFGMHHISPRPMSMDTATMSMDTAAMAWSAPEFITTTATHAGHAGGAVADSGCGDCSMVHLGATGACVIALLLVLIVLPLPRLLAPGRHLTVRAGPVLRQRVRVLPRTPSLVVLCISRT